ncbi:hypothetical protein OU787_01765 [Kitasatospora sp. YST-16]|uniref:hypothetical protein n=1 Tax=unclassified Kitasatospora TaxID=2633591 RepID=UPI0012FEC69B|nr:MULTISPECIES: hypothetical protein [unclassified Kitasatospora]WAL70326.1 hypothetical protein OU787_01765 [Kitasatospora sp. YST-16]WNW36369.1 hypothetical protein RKE32_01780 [Streptomyces sp. Li-HN-5-13]
MAAGLLLCIALGSATDSVTLPVPVVIGGLTFDLPLPSLLPLLPVCLILQGQGRADRLAERVAVRAVGRWDAAFMALCVLVGVATGTALSVGGAGQAAAAMARDFAGYLGLALVLRWLVGERFASVATAVFPFFCVSFGLVFNRPRIWAWPLHDPSSGAGAAQAALLLLIGAGTLALPELRRAPADVEE